MKRSKLKLFMLALSCLMSPLAYAADNVLYTATGSPGGAPDANGTVDVWTVTGVGGSDRSFLQGNQDGNANLWAIWDLDGDGGTYATHTFAGGALNVGQSVSLDWAHNRNITTSIGLRLLDSSNVEVEFIFIGGQLYFTHYDTNTGVHTASKKRYDNYDIFQVVFTLTGPNTYMMSVTEGTTVDTGYNGSDDANPAVGEIVDSWTGSFTGSAIDGIQIYTEGGGSSDQWFDNLDINQNWLDMPSGEYPAHKQVDVVVADLELSWSIARDYSAGSYIVDPNLVSYNVYYNESEPNFIDVTPGSVTNWNSSEFKAYYKPTPELIKNGTCYWRVDTVRNDNTVLEGKVWYFDTELTRVVINSITKYQTVQAGETATFDLVLETDSPAVYQWYKYVDGISDIMLADGENVSGSQSGTLSLLKASSDAEGEYYCIANNDSGIAVTSGRALMGVKRKIAYWTFEDNSVESVIAGSPSMVTIGEPSFVADGVVGNAIEFTEDIDMLFTDPDQTSYFDICDYGMTVSCWVKSTNTQGWVPLVARNGEANGWQLRRNGNTADRPCFTTRGTGNDDGTAANRTIYDGQWHYVAATYNGSIKKVYIDGTLSIRYSTDNGSVSLTGDAVNSPIKKSLSPVAIAGRVVGSGDTFTIENLNNCPGVYDEIEIYNYALDASTIAQAYANLSGENVCLSQAYDLDSDCIVDMDDFALLASEWLSDSIIVPSQN